MLLTSYRVLTSASLMALGVSLSACGTGGNVRIPDSLREPCESTYDASTAAVAADLGRGIIIGDGDLRVCSVKKDAVVAIAEARNRAWWQFWR